MSAFSIKKFRAAAREYAPMLLGLRVPGFIRIHGRYARRSFVTWFVLVIVPFVMGIMSLSKICEKLLEVQVSDLQLYLIMLFLIALAFFCAERNRLFRRVYVASIPAMVVINGLYDLAFTRGLSAGSLITFGIIAGLPAWWLGGHAMGKGYRILSNGADKDYGPGRDFYMDGAYAQAFEYLEPSARRGHMKSLYLIGHAYEHGHGRTRNRVKAACFYDKSSRKGYGKANRAFETLFESFTPAERNAFETDLSMTGSGINELF